MIILKTYWQNCKKIFGNWIAICECALSQCAEVGAAQTSQFHHRKSATLRSVNGLQIMGFTRFITSWVYNSYNSEAKSPKTSQFYWWNFDILMRSKSSKIQYRKSANLGFSMADNSNTVLTQSSLATKLLYEPVCSSLTKFN